MKDKNDELKDIPTVAKFATVKKEVIIDLVMNFLND